MNSEKNEPPTYPIPPYVWRSREVHQYELENYLRHRRAINDVVEEATPDNLSGLCISGGGVRSATLGLGMLQAFIKTKKLKYFDYLSTVSGGGYIGACLTSLLSAEPLHREKKEQNGKGEEILNRNTKFDAGAIGLEENNSPFTNEPYEYPDMEGGKMTTKHQLNHLRQHGEYLTPHKNIKDWDVHRLLGALFGGIVANVSTFLLLLTVLVLLHHVLLAWMSGDQFMQTLQQPTDAIKHFQEQWHRQHPNAPAPATYPSFEQVYNKVTWEQLSASEQFHAWANYRLFPQLDLIRMGVFTHWQIPLGFWILGVVFAALFIFWARKLPYPVVKQEQKEQDYSGPASDQLGYNRHGEETVLDKTEKPFILAFFLLSLLFAPAAAYIVVAQINAASGGNFNYFVMLALPACFSLGLFLGLHFLIFLYFINSGSERVSGWLYRSFYTGMQGGALLALLITILFPLAIILLFGEHGLAVRLSFSFVPVIVAYYFTMQSVGARTGGSGMFTALTRRIQTPLLNLSIFLFVGLTFAWISQAMFALENYLVADWTVKFGFCADWTRTDVVGFLFVVALFLLVFTGFAVNANDVSLHYFYRDRLSEAYLRTNGRMAIKIPGAAAPDSYKLVHLNLRNHEDLKLQHVGEGNYRGPYHLIIAALNLQGSHDLSAKTQKSQHFLFSKFFIGSRTTGYVNTALYQGGGTKLSTAMAISGAAVSSGMGSLSFAASNFYLTLFNLRTGYWLNNPRYFIREYKRNQRKARAEAEKKKPADQRANTPETTWTWGDAIRHKWFKWRQDRPFWLLYIWRELTASLSAKRTKVNVSDGGHTGDNLGLLPLIQRRCSTIVVADFEADGAYSFESFGQAVRLAKSIYNVDINIDLNKIMPQKNEAGELFSPSSVVEGTVIYNIPEAYTDPETGHARTRIIRKKGQIIYMKSSVSLLKSSTEGYWDDAPPPVSEPAPVMVLNYFKKNPQFPHQTTADQYFDEIQFEAYRMLGEHIGRQGAGKVHFGALEAI